MNCEQALPLVAWYPGGRLAQDDGDAVAAHTLACAACRRELVAALAAAECVQAAVAGLPDPPPDLRRAVLAVVTGGRPDARRRSVGRVAPRLRPLVPALLLAVLDAVSALSPAAG